MSWGYVCDQEYHTGASLERHNFWETMAAMPQLRLEAICCKNIAALQIITEEKNI